MPKSCLAWYTAHRPYLVWFVLCLTQSSVFVAWFRLMCLSLASAWFRVFRLMCLSVASAWFRVFRLMCLSVASAWFRLMCLSVASAHLHSLHCFLVTRPQEAQAPAFPHVTLAVVVGDAHRDPHATGPRAGAPGCGLHQAVLLPG